MGNLAVDLIGLMGWTGLWEWLEDLGVALIFLAAVIGAVGVLHSKVISPWVAKPLAKSLRNELKEEVLEIVRGEEVQEAIQESVASEMGVVLDHIQTLTDTVTEEVIPRLERVEAATGVIKTAVKKAAPRKITTRTRRGDG